MTSKKGLTISIKPEDVVYTSIQKSKDNYNSARMVVKVGEKAYMNVGVEWEGDTIPTLAMDMMGTLTASEIAPNTIIPGREVDYGKYKEGTAKFNFEDLKKDKKTKEEDKESKKGKNTKKEKKTKKDKK